MHKKYFYTKILFLNFKLMILIFILSLIASCAKQEVISELTFQKNLLAGSGAYQNEKHTWKIDSLFINGSVFNLSASAKLYYRIFYRNGTTTDRDGLNGTWDMPTVKDLKLKLYTYDNNGKIKDSIINKYQITTLNAAQLHLKYDSNNLKQDLYFISNNQ
jgi:hypothetical protein